MTVWETLAVLVAGVGAGVVNTVVGAGTLMTFPVLLAVGYPPVLANVTNTVGLTPGSVAGAYGYRAELAGQGRRLVGLGAISIAAGLAGGSLLLALPEGAFRAVVPVLIAVAVVLVITQPRLASRRDRRQMAGRSFPGPLGLPAGVLASGLYGGYFGAAQGVLLIGVLGAFLDENLQRINAAKNVLAALVNATAALLFICVTDVAWQAVGLLAIGSMAGSLVGASVGRRLSARVLRGLIVVVGVIAIAVVLAD